MSFLVVGGMSGLGAAESTADAALRQTRTGVEIAGAAGKAGADIYAAIKGAGKQPTVIYQAPPAPPPSQGLPTWAIVLLGVLGVGAVAAVAGGGRSAPAASAAK